MGLRPARCYSQIKNKPFTRISMRRPRKSYVKGVPPTKLHHFELGNLKGNFPLTYNLVAGKDVQIRSNALEAARIIASKYLAVKLGETNYFMKILVYPHHVLRENPMATGGGADRFSKGMRQSFGKPIGQDARVMKGQKIFVVKTPSNSDVVVKEALRRAC